MSEVSEVMGDRMNLDASSGAPAPDSPESSGSMPVEQGGSNREGATAGYLATLPPWARELGLKYLSRTVSLFVLHGNVKDAVPLERDEGIAMGACGEGEGEHQARQLPPGCNGRSRARRELGIG